jgi:hypothetical protein
MKHSHRPLWLRILLVLCCSLAILSVTAPFVVIDVAGIHYEPTSMGVADIASFLYSLDINRVFGSINLLPLVENVKVILPLVGELSVTNLLLMFGDGSLASLTGHIAMPPPDTRDLMIAQHALDTMLLLVIVLLLLSLRRRGVWIRAGISFVVGLGMFLSRNFVHSYLSAADLFKNQTLNRVLNMNHDSIHVDGWGFYLFVGSMVLVLLLSVAEGIWGGTRRGAT